MGILSECFVDCEVEKEAGGVSELSLLAVVV